MKKITLLIMVTFFGALSYSQTTVDCTVGPVNNTGFCYGNNDTTSFVYTSNDGSPLAVTFNAGQVENNWDELIITDSNGTQIYSGYGAAGNLAGLSFESTGDTITIGITSDGSINCAGNGYTPWDFTVSCVDTTQPPSCVGIISPTAGSIDVNEQTAITWGTSTGGPTGYKISIGTTPGGTDLANAIDVGLVNTYNPPTPFPFASIIYVTIIPYNANGDQLGCTESSFTTRLDPNVIVDCASGTPLNVTGFCYDNNNTEVFNYASSDGNSILVLTFNSGNVENNWDELIILDSDGVTELYNGYGNNGNLAGLTVTSTGTSLSITVDSDFTISCLSSTAINPWDYTITCMAPPTCLAPTALAVANVTDSTADISWLAGATETNWEIVIQTAGTGVPTGAGDPTTTNAPYAATALNPSTAYEVYVRADCGAVDGLSEWVGPINFTTLNVPPPPPVGVTCVTAGIPFATLSEDFETDPPIGWTGTTFTGNNGDWDITVGGANSGGTGPSASFSGTMHLEYEASGNSTGIASAISPAIDLTSGFDGAELSFYMHAFGADIGTLNVNVGTSPTGPFTTVYSWIGDLQTTDSQAWVPIGINLDAYLGQTIYVEFSYGGAGTGFEGDMSIDLVEVQTCSTALPSCVSLISPVDGATTIEINQPITWGTAIGSPGGYIVSIGTTPGGTDILNGVDVGNVNTLPLTTNYDTTYYVTILAYNGNGLATGCTEESFTTRPDPNQVFNLVCANGPITVNHCYTNNDDNSFLFTSDSGFPIRLTFASGTITDDDDIINFYSGSDNTGDLIFSGNNAGDLSGLIIESSGGNLFMEIITDGFNSCSTGQGTPWQWTAECLTCFKATASYTVVEDCVMGDQFLVDVEILTTGDAMSITISDDFGSPNQVITTPGVYTFGPYPNATPVVFTVADTDDNNCVLTSEPKTQAFCPDQACEIINAGYDQTQTCGVTSTDLSATFMASSITSDTSTYTISDLQCPPDNLTGTPTSITLDDRWSSVINLGFNFSYFGNTYTDVIIGANGLLSFNTLDANNFCPWNINAVDLIPSPDIPQNAIHGAWHDIDPGVAGNHYIEYTVVGTAPSRQFKVTFFEIPHFSAACNNLLTTQQIILYESSNVIDVIILEKPVCPTWNGGLATLGIQNDGGTVGYAPPGRNTGVWEVTQQELWRFVPAGNPNYTFEWLDPDGNVISNDTDITVSPTEDTTYTASITYALADGSLATLTDDVTVRVQRNPEIVSTVTLEACDDDFDGIADFDLTIQDANVIGTQTDVTVSYYETMADAEAGTNMLADPTVYSSASGTVYVRIQDDITGCYATGSFEIALFLQIDPSNIGLEGECINDDYTITVTPLNNGYDPATVTYEWSGGSSTNTSGSQFVATEDGEYTVTITTADGCASMQTFTVINAMCSFPQGISPNGDNLNDTWDLRAFRVQELEIFTSHGRSVYKKLNYLDEWRGQSNDNDDLPVGTYFYVLRLENGEAKNGWIYLNK